MPVSINWTTKVISVPQSYLTNISGTLYELDTDQFRLDLKAIEQSEEGIPFAHTHEHATQVTVAGVTYARFITIVNGYSVTFEDGQYSVRLSGSNNNFFDVENGILNQNQVQIIPGNSAGLQVVTQGSGVTSQDKTDIVNGVAAIGIDGDVDLSATLQVVLAALAGLAAGGGTGTLTFKNQAGTRDILTMTVDENGNRASVSLNTD